MARFLTVLLAAGCLAGCSEPVAKRHQTKRELQHTLVAYHEYVADHGVPPANVDELAAYRSSPLLNTEPDELHDRALRSGQYVVVWGYDVAEDLDRNGTVLLAYHVDVPEHGGYVAFADGRAELLTPEQFESATLATPTQPENAPAPGSE